MVLSQEFDSVILPNSFLFRSGACALLENTGGCKFFDSMSGIGPIIWARTNSSFSSKKGLLWLRERFKSNMREGNECQKHSYNYTDSAH